MGKKIQLLGLALKDGSEFEEKTVFFFLGFNTEQVNTFISEFDNDKIIILDYFSLNTKTEEQIFLENSDIEYYKHFEIDSTTENDTMESAADQLNFVLNSNLIFNIVDIYLLLYRDVKVLCNKVELDDYEADNKKHFKELLDGYNQIKEDHNNLIDDYHSLNEARKEVIDAYQTLFNKYNALYDDYEKIINKYNDLNHQTKSYSREIQNLKYTNQSIERSSQIQRQNFENKLTSRKIICPKCNGTGTIRHYNASMQTWIDNYCCPVCLGNKRVNEYG
jgi:hypothetical protein